MPDLTTNRELLTGLACVALSRGLRSVLIFDAPYPGLQRLAAMLEQMLHVTTGLPVQTYQPGPFATDEDVWGSVELPGSSPLHRLFSPERNAGEFQLISVPDLVVLSQAAARTYTMLVGAEIAHLERHGQHQSWQPQQCWLAACARADIGKVSPHLLDRFALRLQWHDIDPAEHFNSEMQIAHLLAHVPRNLSSNDELLAQAILRQLAAARRRLVVVSPEVLAQAMDYIPHEQYYPRREIALARFALALAQFTGALSLSEEHIEDAARMLGMTAQSGKSEYETSEQQEQSNLEHNAGEPPEQLSSQPQPASFQTPSEPQTQWVNLPETISRERIESGTLCSENPYPEDTAFVEREAASLQLAITRYSPSRSAHGPIIGVEESDTLSDLAIASTILTALKFQGIRRSNQQEQQHKIVFEHTDLRRYRRGSAFESVLMILLDYTSVRRNANWQDVLLPYLSKAYADRAGIVIIKVGSRDAGSELQAEIVSARNIMVPSIGEALELESGKASPLAHGLSLAREKLRHLLQHGRAITRQVTFLVISDGRGNLPREVSLKNLIQNRIIAQEGVEDALNEAVQISALQRVEILVLNPHPLYYPELPSILAQALGAQIQAIPLAGDGDETGADL